MMQFDISHLKKVRVWIGELPDAQCQAKKSLQATIEARPSFVAGARYAAVEFYAYVGPRDVYGLLGAKFTPNRSERLVIKVAVSDDAKTYNQSLAGTMDQVHVGLLSEYVESVLDAAVRSTEVRQLGSGLLIFDHGAHGKIGSSRATFGRLTRAVVHILASGARSVEAEEIDTFLRLDSE